jgi:hypothetical protein
MIHERPCFFRIAVLSTVIALYKELRTAAVVESVELGTNSGSNDTDVIWGTPGDVG